MMRCTDCRKFVKKDAPTFAGDVVCHRCADRLSAAFLEGRRITAALGLPLLDYAERANGSRSITQSFEAMKAERGTP